MEVGNLIDELLASLQGRVLNPDLGVDLAVDLAQLGYPVAFGGLELDGVAVGLKPAEVPAWVRPTR